MLHLRHDLQVCGKPTSSEDLVALGKGVNYIHKVVFVGKVRSGNAVEVVIDDRSEDGLEGCLLFLRESFQKFLLLKLEDKGELFGAFHDRARKRFEARFAKSSINSARRMVGAAA